MIIVLRNGGLRGKDILRTFYHRRRPGEAVWLLRTAEYGWLCVPSFVNVFLKNNGLKESHCCPSLVNAMHAMRCDQRPLDSITDSTGP